MSHESHQRNKLNLAAKITLIFTFIIILAGNIVRITGSGMGCPDWPKCFGYYIPPSDISTVQLQEGRTYAKGQMVIYHDTLWKTEREFIYSSDFWRTNVPSPNFIKSLDYSEFNLGSPEFLKIYPKHQYAKFNSLHTWIEYINRLLTALLGIPLIILTYFALSLFKKNKDYWPLIYVFLCVFLSLFEAWLGKMVVDKNLNTSTITLHMVGSLGILLSLLFLIRRTSEGPNITLPVTLRKALSFFFLIHLVQLLLGTQVRESVDLLLENGVGRNILIENLPVGFKIHRSFSILIVILATMMYLQYSRLENKPRKFFYLFIVLGFEILFGIGMAYFGVPIALQPLHLLFSIILFALSGMLLLESKKK